MKKGEKASDELRKKLSEAHKGQISYRKGKTFVSAEIQEAKRKKYIAEWRKNNKEKLNKQQSEWREKNREMIRIQARERYHQKRKHQELARHRKRKYGVEDTEYLAIVEKQGGRCAICKDKPNISLSIDHNHVTGQIRGLICNPCNIAIAKAKDSPEILRAMAKYLEYAEKLSQG